MVKEMNTGAQRADKRIIPLKRGFSFMFLDLISNVCVLGALLTQHPAILGHQGGVRKFSSVLALTQDRANLSK